MNINSIQNKAVVITGGTKGLGKSIGMAYAREGAQVYLTHKWGTVDDAEIFSEFQAQKIKPPIIVNSDVGDSESVLELFKQIKSDKQTVGAIISNVAFSQIINDIDEMKRNSMNISLQYSSWPIVELAQTCHKILEHYPRYLIGISSDGPDICHLGYDLAGSSKALLETLTRYLALRLKPFGTRVNAIRPGFLLTDSSRATFGEETMATINKKVPQIFLDTAEIANVCVALSSGLMDCVTGQIITADEGWSLVSPIAYLTEKNLPPAFPKE